ncbi:SatD family protein [Tessaracoccus sp.]
MAKMKMLPESVALLGDLVGSRSAARAEVHDGLLHAIERANSCVPSRDPLRVTVGDEIQGVYATLGNALHASILVRSELFGTADMRFGIGGGDVRVIDADLGIQDGNAWWLARDAIDFVEELAQQPGHAGVRTAIRDQRTTASPVADAMVRLVDVHIHGLRDGARRSLIGLLAGLDNAAVARSEGITESANSQRVGNNNLRVLADAIHALELLP